MNKAYENFINENKNRKLVLIELGVGFNTPGIIRFSFERLAYTNNNITLIRINDKYNDMVDELQGQLYCVKEDCAVAISNILK